MVLWTVLCAENFQIYLLYSKYPIDQERRDMFRVQPYVGTSDWRLVLLVNCVCQPSPEECLYLRRWVGLFGYLPRQASFVLHDRRAGGCAWAGMTGHH